LNWALAALICGWRAWEIGPLMAARMATGRSQRIGLLVAKALAKQRYTCSSDESEASGSGFGVLPFR